MARLSGLRHLSTLGRLNGSTMFQKLILKPFKLKTKLILLIAQLTQTKPL